MHTSSAGCPSNGASRTSMMVAASRAGTGPGGWSEGWRRHGEASCPRLLRPTAASPADVATEAAVGRLARSSVRARCRRRHSTETAGLLDHGDDAGQRHRRPGPRRPAAPSGAHGPRHVGLRGPHPVDRGGAPRGEDHPGLDHGRSPRRWRRPRRAWCEAATSVPGAVFDAVGAPPGADRARPCSSGQPALSIGGRPGRGLRRCGVLPLLRRRAVGAREPPWADSGPSPTWAPRRRRTPRSSRAPPPSPSTAPPTAAATSPSPPSRSTERRPSTTAPAGLPRAARPLTRSSGRSLRRYDTEPLRARHRHLALRRRGQPAGGVGSRGSASPPASSRASRWGRSPATWPNPSELRHPGDTRGGQHTVGGHLRGHRRPARRGVRLRRASGPGPAGLGLP